jgi:hypothetical protein
MPWFAVVQFLEKQMRALGSLLGKRMMTLPRSGS